MATENKKFTAEEVRFATQNSKLFHALGDKNRIKVLLMLADRPYLACDLLTKLNISQPTLSAHLKVLRSAGFVSVKPMSKYREYSLNEKGFLAIKEFLNSFDI